MSPPSKRRRPIVHVETDHPSRFVWRPIIAPSAVRAFLNRELDDFYFLKEAPADEIKAEALKIHDWVREPWSQQAVGLLIATILKRFLFLYDLGLGKTQLAVEIVRYWRAHGYDIQALVLVPKHINVTSWEEELRAFKDIKHKALVGSRDERIATLDTKRADIWLLPYDGLQSFMTRLMPNKGKRGGVMKRQIVKQLADDFVARFNMLIADECHELATPSSLVFRMCNRISERVEFCYPMTGTPFGRDPIKLWTQFFICDRGETLGPNIGLFREAFYLAKEERIGRTEDDVVLKWEYNTKLEPKLERMLRHRSLRYEEKEVQELPPLMGPFKRVLPFAEEQRMYYRQARAKLEEVRMTARGNYRALRSPFIRMRQICAGFTTYKDDETDDRIAVLFKDNPKRDAIIQLALEMPSDCKMMIFHEFIQSGQIIRDAFDELGLHYASIHHGNHKSQDTEYRKFLNDKSCHWFIVNTEVGGTGINPQAVCNYIVFFEDPIKTWQKRQAIKRAHRPGQTKRRVFAYNLIMQNSVDEDVFEYCEQGQDLMAALFKNGARVLRKEEV